MTQDQVVDLMKSSKNEQEWNDNCDKVKQEFGGQYPRWWYSAIIIGGILHMTKMKWSRST